MVTGESYFKAPQQPYIYFTVLLLTLQFEAVSQISILDIIQIGKWLVSIKWLISIKWLSSICL